MSACRALCTSMTVVEPRANEQRPSQPQGVQIVLIMDGPRFSSWLFVLVVLVLPGPTPREGLDWTGLGWMDGWMVVPVARYEAQVVCARCDGLSSLRIWR